MSNIHIKTAFSGIRRSPFQAMAAIFVLTITFFVVTTLAVLVYSSDQILKHFETRPQVIAFLKDDAKSSAVANLQTKLTNDTRVKEVNYVTKEKALSIYKKATADNPLLSELVSPSIFPASVEFSLVDLSFAEAVIDEVKEEAVVDQVGFTANIGGEATLKDTVSRLRALTWYVRIGGAVFVGILTLTSFLVLIVIISMRLTSRRHEVEVLNLVGATRGFIKAPIVLEAVIYAFVGVITGWLLAVIMVLYAAPSIISYFGNIAVLPKDTVELFILFSLVLAGQMVIGVFLAVVGSSLAVSRAQKKK